MQPYLYALHSGVQTEELGAMGMRDDSEAVAFGEQLAKDLAKELAKDLAKDLAKKLAKDRADAKRHAGAAIAIIQGQRIVRSIPLGVTGSRR